MVQLMEPETTATRSVTLSLSGRDHALLEAAAELLGLTLAEFLRASGISVARYELGLESFTPEELARQVLWSEDTPEA
jgi:hypothetical protein